MPFGARGLNGFPADAYFLGVFFIYLFLKNFSPVKMA